MKKNWFYILSSIPFFLIPILRILIVKWRDIWLIDFAAYSAVSRALFEGNNPFPNHGSVLFCSFGSSVPIVYPGQMILFALPGFLWGNAVQFGFLFLNIAIVFFLTALTLVKACDYQWRELWTPGKKQLIYALCCFAFLFSSNTMNIMRTGQIVLVLALCMYCMFWGLASQSIRTLLFAFIALTKYSVLPVFAPLLFFKRHWKLCFSAFGIFLLFSISPILCGNNLVEVYSGYIQAVETLFQPGQVNHFNMRPQMCHIGFFRFPIINHISKVIVICPILWLFWRERKTKKLSDTSFLLALSLTMLISYHGLYDISLIFPLLFIRLFDFAKKKQWFCFLITFLFLFYLLIPGSITLTFSSWLGSIPGIDSIVYLSDKPWGSHYQHVFPITPFFAIALTIWDLYLYLHVSTPYQFELSNLDGKASAKEL